MASGTPGSEAGRGIMTLTHIDLFAGIMGFSLGFERAGIETVAYVEIDPACQSVIRRHKPDALILSDVREAGKHNLPYADIVSFGSPCQDLSVAGRRRGLAGSRSGLFYEAIRIVDELRPAFAVWENVPGALSSHDGRDFAAVLNAFRGIGACDIAWRTLDAQHFGVAQRRRRIYLVADFRRERAAEILFEREGGTGDIEPGVTAGQGLTAPTGAGASGARLAKPLLAKSGYRANPTDENYVYNERNEAEMLVVDRCERIDRWIDEPDRIRAIQGDAKSSTAQEHVYFKPNAVTNALEHARPAKFIGASGVRRLTPLECERLQGFPDGWTAGQSDSQRYRQLGNAVAVPVVEWLAQRIVALGAKP